MIGDLRNVDNNLQGNMTERHEIGEKKKNWRL